MALLILYFCYLRPANDTLWILTCLMYNIIISEKKTAGLEPGTVQLQNPPGRIVNECEFAKIFASIERSNTTLAIDHNVHRSLDDDVPRLPLISLVEHWNEKIPDISGSFDMNITRIEVWSFNASHF